MAENPETVITSSVMIPLTRAGKPRGSKNYSTLFKETRASNLAVIRVAVEKRKAMKEDERRAKDGPPLRRGGQSLARLSSLTYSPIKNHLQISCTCTRFRIGQG